MSSRTPRHEVTTFRNQFMNLSRRLRREAHAHDRSWVRLQLLGAIERAGDAATPTMLGESENMRSSNLAAALRELKADGLIIRMPDAKDRRKVRVRLSRAGREVLHRNITRREQWLADAIERCLTREERALLFKAGELLNRLASVGGTASGK
ncbi:MarR family transcriptional regulator [Bradyrhizobium sp. Leo121]|nr:MarR family transcriptional regulator [Bradyrhizobium sp. Leo121]